MAIQINKIESAIMEFPNGSKVPVGKYINLPITWESVLDETHGTAKVLMTDMRQSDFDQYRVRIDGQFKVNIPIEIKFVGQETFIRMIVARDTAEMTRKDGWETWSHNVEFVDEVKKLEQEPVDNLTFKNPISREYDVNASSSWYMTKSDGKESVIDGCWKKPTVLKSLYLQGSEISISDNADTWDYNNGSDWTRKIEYIKFKVTTPSGNQFILYSPTENTGTAGSDLKYIANTYSFATSEIGEYYIEVEIRWYYASAEWHYTTYGLYFYVSTDSSVSIRASSIQDVIQRILDVTPTRTVNGENKYFFRNNAEEYATEESPEFTFTGKHLFEVMLDIASYKKMFPALYKNEIYFRPFWNGVMLTNNDLPPPIKAVLNSAIDQYCTALDSYVENMVCINDSNVGTVVEPYAGGYISARSNSGSEISETTAVIPTQSAIYQPIALEMGETDETIVGDIQTYVYEQEDYDALSDTSAAYPYSKGYAIKFNRFSNNYTELAHRIETSSEIAKALTYPALANIVQAKTGEKVGVELKEYIKALIGLTNSHSFADLLFQPSYIPVVNARVRQYKPMFSTEDYEATLFYNQQSEVVDSEAFGEHVKGLVQKLGNHTEIRVYRFDRVDDIPTVGTLIDEKSVYDVAMTIYENHVDATICFVDYAELSTYIGVKNEIKTSDISSTKWCNRFINWEEFLIFTHETYTGNALSITKDSLTDIVSFTTLKPLTCAMLSSFTESGEMITTAFTPIKHLALGNSIYFQWEMLDNFAVGYKSEKAPEGATSVLSGTQYDRAQRAVRYCDVYGRAETIDFQLLKEGPTTENSTFESPSVDAYISDGKLTVSLSESREVYLSVQIIVDHQTEEKDKNGEYIIMTAVYTFMFEPHQLVVDSGDDDLVFDEEYDTIVVVTKAEVLIDTEAQKGAFMRAIAHSLPRKPNNLIYSPKPAFQLYDWLIKKNSAEALKFAAQYHFRQTWREFVIGSGMSNFCSLVGGACTGTKLITLKKPLNRFERHIEKDPSVITVHADEIQFLVEEEYKRVKITLPAVVNSSADIKSWALVGWDKNSNIQLIFGENKKATDEPFEETIYLVAMQKNNEPPQKATYTLQLDRDEAVRLSIYVDGDLVSLDVEDKVEVRRYATVKVEPIYIKSTKIMFDGDYTTERVIAQGGSYSFLMKKDTSFTVYPADVIIM